MIWVGQNGFVTDILACHNIEGTAFSVSDCFTVEHTGFAKKSLCSDGVLECGESNTCSVGAADVLCPLGKQTGPVCAVEAGLIQSSVALTGTSPISCNTIFLNPLCGHRWY